MTIEEAKELLNICPICIGIHDGCNCKRHEAYVWVFERLEALEKLEERKTQNKPIQDIFRNSTCPECNRVVRQPYYKYCPECGQKLDWSEY